MKAGGICYTDHVIPSFSLKVVNLHDVRISLTYNHCRKFPTCNPDVLFSCGSPCVWLGGNIQHTE